jgi:hypothetical protein
MSINVLATLCQAKVILEKDFYSGGEIIVALGNHCPKETIDLEVALLFRTFSIKILLLGRDNFEFLFHKNILVV